ncbi:sugar transferase [Halobacillus andaensis]|uniref:sugar transferase n=1 Tax=Halobacillus andaensis TaxID=1176239 RepID=UPI001E2BF91A
MIVGFLDLSILCLGLIVFKWLYYGLTSSSGALFTIEWVLLSIIAGYIAFSLFDMYSDIHGKDLRKTIYSVVFSMVFYLMIFSFLSLWMAPTPMQNSILLNAGVVQAALIMLWRVSLWKLIREHYGIRKVIVVGKNYPFVHKVLKKFISHQQGLYEVTDHISTFDPASSKVREADILFIDTELNAGSKKKIIHYCLQNDKEVFVIPDFNDLLLGNGVSRQIDDVLIYSHNTVELSACEKFMKRAFDLTIASLLLIISSPVFLFLYVLIPLHSKGPALYKQERLGYKAQPYYIYKFRSMVQDAELNTGPVLASEKDPRITSVGKVIRAMRLDELPQLLNVLKGEMSLIGPRPERDYFVEQFKEEIPEYEYRFNVKPGITGLAQIYSNYTTEVENKLRYDLIYARQYTLSMDLKILFQTLLVMVNHKQAKGTSNESSMVSQQKLLKGNID